MLLHNQRGAPVSWEANGKVYSWEPYGACELPDALVPLIKSEGFPVDIAPVPPREKADRAAALETDSELVRALGQARKELASANDTAQEAKSAAEAADIRSTAVRAEADAAIEKARVLEGELASIRGDSREYENMIAAGQTEIASLKEQLKAMQAKGAKPKEK